MATQLDFSNRNLRNRSFRGQDLKQANFSGSDLRGCQFDLAQLQGANFDRSRIGYAPESILMGLVMVAGWGAIAFHAISQMLFGVLEITAEAPTYPYLIVLMLFLVSAGLSCAAIRVRGRASLSLKLIAGLTTSAVLGFFYGGTWMGDNPQAAISAAVVLGGLGAIVSTMTRSPLITMAICTVGGCAAYGVLFFAGARATSLLSLQQVWAGGIWSLLSLLFLGLTLKIIAILLAALQDFAHTSWRGADLTDATFNGVNA